MQINHRELRKKVAIAPPSWNICRGRIVSIDRSIVDRLVVVFVVAGVGCDMCRPPYEEDTWRTSGRHQKRLARTIWRLVSERKSVSSPRDLTLSLFLFSYRYLCSALACVVRCNGT